MFEANVLDQSSEYKLVVSGIFNFFEHLLLQVFKIFSRIAWFKLYFRLFVFNFDIRFE